jgi:SAM-dependent methyltransferase
VKDDKTIERERYDSRARRVLQSSHAGSSFCNGALDLPEILRSPYLLYESELRARLSPGSVVLEIGAGSGNFTGTLIGSGARVVATDISSSSLKLLKARFGATASVECGVADMESLPFGNASFDIVAIAGSLSYGDNESVMHEIHRVLRKNGALVCVDSLNHNPIYRLNRWIQYRFGNRSRSTIVRMPTLGLIDRYDDVFDAVKITYFGSLSWLAPALALLFGGRITQLLSDKTDRIIRVRRAAFKFVMVAEKST